MRENIKLKIILDNLIKAKLSFESCLAGEGQMRSPDNAGAGANIGEGNAVFSTGAKARASVCSSCFVLRSGNTAWYPKVLISLSPSGG